MTTRVLCDKCGIDFSDDYQKFYIGDIRATPSLIDIDLCRDCTTEFTNWLKEKPTDK